MRIHRITLRNFRGVAESTVTFPETGVTIVEGDNEVGKSCIAESIDLVLHAPDSAMNRRIKAVCPVHRDEGPEVEIEMTTGPYRFVLVKRWHRQRKTELTITHPQRANLVGREAHDKVAAMLAETLDDQLFTALRLEQGVDLQIPGFDVPSLGRALDRAVGGDQGGDREDDLWSRITAERDRYWTPTGLKKGERDQLARQLADAKDEVARSEAQLRELELAVDEVVSLVERARVVVEAEADHARQEATFLQRWEAIERRQTLVRQLSSDLDAATARHARLLDESIRRGEMAESAAEALVHLDDAIAERARIQPELDAIALRGHEVHAALDIAKSALVEGERGYRLACDDRDHRRGEIEIAQLTERRDRVIAAQQRSAEAETLLDAVAIDDAMLARIEDAHVALLHAEMRADHGSTRVELTSLDGSPIEVAGEAIALGPGASEHRQVGDSLDFGVPGVARFRVSAGAEAQGAIESAEVARRQFRELLAQAGVADVHDARSTVARRRDAERALDDATTTIRQDLRDLTLESLSAKIERLGTRLADYAAERADEPVLAVDLDAAQRGVAEMADLLDELRLEFHRWEDAAAGLSVDLERAQRDGVSLQVRIEQLQSTADHLASSLEETRAARSDDAIAAELSAATSAVASAAGRLDEAQRSLEGEDPSTVADLLQNARDTRRRTANDLLDLTERRIKLETELEVKGEMGLAALLGDAQRRVAHLQLEHDRLEARAEAARVLHDAFAARRDEARDRYLSPFQSKIERFAKLVFGPTFEVTLDRELRIATRTLDGVTLDVEHLSVGAREQLAILSRLACAALVSADGGAPVLLDDALGWTDPARLDRMGAAIAVAARECQIIVLTCTPGRYQSVGNASVVHLTR